MFTKLTSTAAQPAPTAAAVSGTVYRGTRYSVIQEPSGGWRWKVLPANPGLHAYEYSIPHGARASREAAEAAARAAIDAQLDA